MNDAEQIQITGGWRVRDAMANTGRPRETYAALRLVQLQPCTAQSAAQAYCCFPVGTEGRRRARGDPEHVAPSSDRSSKEPDESPGLSPSPSRQHIHGSEDTFD